MREALFSTYRSAITVPIRRAVFLSRRDKSPRPLWSLIHARTFDSNVRHMAERLESLKNRYTGERCFIMGNGPSLNLMDLELFSQDYVWGLNKCFLLYDRISWRPHFYTAVDSRVVPDIAVEISEEIEKLKDNTFFFPVNFREQGLLPSAQNVFWYLEVTADDSKLPEGMFSSKVASWVSSVGTVTIAALQLAVHLGFNPIYLVGCDTSYQLPTTVHFENGKSYNLISTEDDDLNHFDPAYFGKGSKWHQPRVENMIFHYQQAKAACDFLGVAVFNATVGGKLEVFPRVRYEELF